MNMNIKQLFEKGVPVLYNNTTYLDNLLYKGLCTKIIVGKQIYYKATYAYVMLVELYNSSIDDKGMLKTPPHKTMNTIKDYIEL